MECDQCIIKLFVVLPSANIGNAIFDLPHHAYLRSHSLSIIRRALEALFYKRGASSPVYAFSLGCWLPIPGKTITIYGNFGVDLAQRHLADVAENITVDIWNSNTLENRGICLVLSGVSEPTRREHFQPTNKMYLGSIIPSCASVAVLPCIWMPATLSSCWLIIGVLQEYKLYCIYLDLLNVVKVLLLYSFPPLSRIHCTLREIRGAVYRIPTLQFLNFPRCSISDLCPTSTLHAHWQQSLIYAPVRKPIFSAMM
jgi:hypothetical protein